jgi:8-hydroxy-5-deazaflavin:NADPH oxidoreductase
MHVTVIGAGNMGRGIGHRLVAGGHDVTVVDRDPEEAGRLAEELAAALPANARVVKAFNTTFSGTLVEGEIAGQPLEVLLAGDDEGAKETVAQLVRDGGLRAIDTGPLERARQLEGLGFLHITLQQTLGTGFGSAVKILG